MTSHTIKNWLTEYKEMRERRNKNKYLGALILKSHGIEITPILKSKMDDIVSDILSADRLWRQVLEQHEELRGEDYGTKTIVEQQAMINLGYEPNYHNDTKHENIPQ